jgi:hypothetical protein
MSIYYIVTNNKIGFFKINYDWWAEITENYNYATRLKVENIYDEVTDTKGDIFIIENGKWKEYYIGYVDDSDNNQYVCGTDKKRYKDENNYIDIVEDFVCKRRKESWV